LLTLRDSGLAQHAGQVSLPGGEVENDESFAEAALREAEEEVGLDPVAVRLLGELSPLHVPVSGFVIHPWAAVTQRRPALTPDRREVARILEVPLEDLRDPSRQRVERRTGKGGRFDIPFFDVDGERVWGATAMILSEFLCLLGTPPEPVEE
jgi:8-oxo-dGTP pyrophosphatase MutT (NUDIX family)